MIQVGYQSEDEELNANNFCPLDTFEDSNITLSFDEACKYTELKSAAQTKVNNNFKTQCLNKQECNLSINENYFPPECRAKIGDQWNLFFDEDFVNFVEQEEYVPFMGYAIYECTASDIGSRSREGAARFIVSFDIIVVIVFLLAIWTLQYFVRIDFDQDKDQTFEIS